jgi:hypothetical protein
MNDGAVLYGFADESQERETRTGEGGLIERKPFLSVNQPAKL